MPAAAACLEYAPSPQLARHVECFWTESPAASRVQRVVPDGAVDFLFDLNRAKAIVVGAMTRPRLVPVQAGERTLAVRFRPGGAAPLVGVAIDVLTDREVPLDELWPDARSLAARLAERPTFESARADLGEALRDQLAPCATRDLCAVSPVVLEGIRLLTSGLGITVARSAIAAVFANRVSGSSAAAGGPAVAPRWVALKSRRDGARVWAASQRVSARCSFATRRRADGTPRCPVVLVSTRPGDHSSYSS
jgi:hypothetical protein